MTKSRIIPSLLACLVVGGTQAVCAASPAHDPMVVEIQHVKVFAEPLVPIGGMPSAEESTALQAAIHAYRVQGDTERVEPFVKFLEAYPRSPWRSSLLLDMGLTYRHTGYFTRALDAWEQSWALSKNSSDPDARAVADRSVCELIELNSRLGRQDRLKDLYAEIAGRSISGSSAQRVHNLREGLWLMQNEPGTSFRCGPMALAACARVLGHPDAIELLGNFKSTTQGTSLEENVQWAKKCGLAFDPVYRKPGEAVVVPSLVHWKAGHFAAIVKKEGDRYLLQDPTFGEETWVSRNAIDDEASGYELVPHDRLPSGWRIVGQEEASAIRGKGTVGTAPKNGPFPPKTKPASCGMPTYSFDLPYVALEFGDIPVGYQPPRGYPVQFELNYTQQDTYQPQTFSYSNVGTGWSFTWLSYITDDPANPGQNVALFSQIGGQEPFAGYNASSGAFAPQAYTYESLVRVGAGNYQLTHPDGSKEIYSQVDGASTYPRRVFLSQRIDAAGNTLTFSYDAQMRLTAVTDALGHATSLSYGSSSDPYKITQVTDPFGRTAKLTYNGSGLLSSITDALGLVSSFAYGPTSASPSAAATFVNAMTTPYGTTSFTCGGGGINKWVVATDPLGNSERMEFSQSGPTIPVSFPTGVSDSYMTQRNVYFWDKRAMQLYPGDYTHAQVYHFLHAYPNDPDISVLSQLLEATYKPLEGWIFRTYPGQTLSLFEGPAPSPSSVARVLDGGATQSHQYTYNAMGHVTQETDPVGRITSYIYAANGIDLLEVRNTTGGRNDLLAKYTYNTQHRPLTVTDASGQTTTFTYKSTGQVATVTNAKQETTTMVYDPSGYLVEIDGAMPAAKTTFGYDNAGRVASVTGPDGYAVFYAYDNLDRRTQVTFPDGTTEQTIYDRLDVGATKDRLNRWVIMTHNPLRQLIEVQDASGRTTRFNWCGCGTLESIVDPLNRITSWSRDLEGRVISKIYPDLTQTQFGYDGTGRLSGRVDAKGQVTSYSYGLDDSLTRTSYVNTQVPTPSVSFTYDPAYPRVASMTDGTGMTLYSYLPITTDPALGAGRLLSVQGPLANSTITYGYDELGRMVNRTIGTASETRAFDALGRLSQVANPLGTFNYTYVGGTNRMSQVTLPNGQVTKLTYQDATGDFRLSEIANLKADGSNISTFGYSYDAAGQIQTWTKQADAQSPQVTTFAYDPVGQVLSAITNDGTVSGQVLKTFIYGYDDAANRTSEQIDGNVTTSTYNNLNQLTGQRTSATTAPLAGPPSGRISKQGKARPTERSGHVQSPSGKK